MENTYRRKRSPNFTSSEEEILKDLVKKYSHIIQNKYSNTLVWYSKNLTWEKIGKEFAILSGTTRDIKCLRNKYANIKTTEKKLAHEKNEICISGDRLNKSLVITSQERIPNFELDNSVISDTLLSNNNDDFQCVEFPFPTILEELEVWNSVEFASEENKNFEEPIQENVSTLFTVIPLAQKKPKKLVTLKKRKYNFDQDISKAKLELLKNKCISIENETKNFAYGFINSEVF